MLTIDELDDIRDEVFNSEKELLRCPDIKAVFYKPHPPLSRFVYIYNASGEPLTEVEYPNGDYEIEDNYIHISRRAARAYGLKMLNKGVIK